MKKCFTDISWLSFLILIGVAFNTPVSAQINQVGGFEGDMPSYWTKGAEPTGATLTWAVDQARSMGKSLKITKTATSEAAVWESENMLDLWSPQNYKDVDIKIGAYVRTENVNTNPANDDARWYVSYSFYDSAGALMGEAKLPIDQSAATSGGWVADTNGVGETILTKDSWKTIIKFVGGKDATGTVWADDFMLVGRAGGWAGQNWNTSVDMPTGWNYWLPPVGGNDGELSKGYENTRVTDEEAYSGTHSLKFDLPFTREQGDAWVGTRRYLLNNDAPLLSMQGSKDISSLTNINPGDSLRISVMVKASNLVPDSAALYPGTWSVGFTPIFHSGYLNNDPYDEIDPHDLTFAFPNVTSFDWTKHHVDIAVPDNEAAIALSVRLHVYSRFTGTIFFDDVTVEKIYSSIGVKDGDNSVPTEFKLANNYPNPFNPSTRINYSVPKAANVSIAVYNILGKRIATLTNRPHNPGNYSVTWNGTNDEGLKVSSGIYFYTLTSDNSVSIIKKMILMK